MWSRTCRLILRAMSTKAIRSRLTADSRWMWRTIMCWRRDMPRGWRSGTGIIPYRTRGILGGWRWRRWWDRRRRGRLAERITNSRVPTLRREREEWGTPLFWRRTIKKVGQECPTHTDIAESLFFVFFFFRFGFVRSRSFALLSLFLLFHGFARFFSFLGTGFGALLSLFVEKLFAAQQLDEGFVSAIAFLPIGANNAGVAAVAIAKARADGIEQLVHGLFGHQVSRCLPAGGEISALAERDHLFDGRTQGFGFGNRGLNALFDYERSGHVAQQRAAMRGGTSEFESCHFVTHRNLKFQSFKASKFQGFENLET